MTGLQKIFREIDRHPSNEWARALGYHPVYTVSEQAKVVIVGQAPGRKAQESGIPWNDASGVRLRRWLGVNNGQFYDSDLFALLPMDFYYPGKGAHGDLPPRKSFAPAWHPKILDCLPDIQLIILVGSYAQKYYLGDQAKANLTLTVAAYEEYLPRYFPLVHPSPLNLRWLAKNPWFESQLVPILQVMTAKILQTDQ